MVGWYFLNVTITSMDARRILIRAVALYTKLEKGEFSNVTSELV